MPFYPQNSVQPQCRTRSKPNLNIIFVLIIITHAQGSIYVKKYGGQGYLAAPYCVGGVFTIQGLSNSPHWPPVQNSGTT